MALAARTPNPWPASPPSHEPVIDVAGSLEHLHDCLAVAELNHWRHAGTYSKS